MWTQYSRGHWAAKLSLRNRVLSSSGNKDTFSKSGKDDVLAHLHSHLFSSRDEGSIGTDSGSHLATRVAKQRPGFIQVGLAEGRTLPQSEPGLGSVRPPLRHLHSACFGPSRWL